MDTIKTIRKIINQYSKHYPMTLEQKINVMNNVIDLIIANNNLLEIPYICQNSLKHYLSGKYPFDYALYRKIINNYVPPTNNIVWLFDMFLKKNKIYRKFHKEYKKTWSCDIELLTLGVRAEGIIRNAFTWSTTEQGKDYWYNINQIFTKFINKNTVRLNQTEINKLNSYKNHI